MTNEERAHLERRLLEERARVVESLQRYERTAEEGDDQDRDGDLSKVPFHPADQGTDTMQEELDASLASRDSATLEEIDAALQRLYRNPERFGRDERTGEEIPFERLDVVPWARTRAGRG
jgi:DnaK suppressor protein